jgi:hypothetical protein
LALLEDRVLMKQGKGQLYGSQIVDDENGNPTLYTVEDPANIGKRRAAVGLPPISEFLNDVSKEIGIPVGLGNLPTN